jgi:hypothetical protein
MIRLIAQALLPRLFQQQIVSLSQSSCVSPVELSDGRGEKGVSQIIRPRESLALYTSFNTLWVVTAIWA